MLVHGLYTSRTMWRPQVQELRAAGIPAVVPDLPGHGARIGERFALEAALETVDDAVARARRLGASEGPVVLAGLSLGGYLAMEFAGRHPERIDGLIALACSTRPIEFGVRVYRGIARGLARLPDRGYRLDAMAQRLVGGRQAAKAFLAGGYAIDAAEDAVTAIAGLDSLGSVATAAAAGLPIWFVNGEFDQMRLEQTRFHRAARGSLRTVVPGAPHLVNLAAPATVSRLLVVAARTAS